MSDHRNNNADAVLDKAATLSSLPPEWNSRSSSSTTPHEISSSSSTLSSTIRRHIQQEQDETASTVLVVLDDDPTGTQTVYDIPVLTTWDQDTLNKEIITNDTPAFYILTNSRCMTSSETERIHVDIMSRLLSASKQCGKRLSVISRSDSTLRGHYPLEIDVIARMLQQQEGKPADDDESRPNDIDGQLLIPFFYEGGRFTLNDVHYVAEGTQLIPAAQTPFAKDAAFGFTQSNLRHYIEEKTAGVIKKDDVVSISLDDIRTGGPDKVRQILNGLTKMQPCIVNAASLSDAQVVALGLMNAESLDKKCFVVRSAASYVQARIGLDTRPILSADAINHCEDNKVSKEEGEPATTRGGLVVVGSYVPKTTRQLESIRSLSGGTGMVEMMEINASDLADPTKRDKTVESTLNRVETVINAGITAVVYTSRILLEGTTPAESLSIGNAISSGLVTIVSHLQTQPKFIVAKGGITSSDVATKGLGIKRAMVLGQACPGVPVWSCGSETKFPGMSYVVFPGNVGGDEALSDLVSRLTSSG